MEITSLAALPVQTAADMIAVGETPESGDVTRTKRREAAAQTASSNAVTFTAVRRREHNE